MTAKVEPLQTNDYHFDTLAPVTRFISTNTGLLPTTMAEFQILLGIVIGFQMLIRMGVDKLRRMVFLMSKVKTSDPKKIWLNDLQNIKTDFFQDILYNVDKILLKFDDVLAYCHSVTVSQFSMQFGEDLRPEVIKEISKWVDFTQIPVGSAFKEEELDEEFKKYLAAKVEEEVRKKQETDDALKKKMKLVNFDEIDRKIEELFGLKMGEFLKEDDDILKSHLKEDENSAIKKKAFDSKDDSAMRDIADDLRSGKSKSKKGGSNNKMLPSNSGTGPIEKSKQSKSKKSDKKSSQNNEVSKRDNSQNKSSKPPKSSSKAIENSGSRSKLDNSQEKSKSKSKSKGKSENKSKSKSKKSENKSSF